MKIAYLNNRFLPLRRAKISVLDRGFMYGDGIFETMRSYNGTVYLLERHLDRLFSSLGSLRIDPGITKKKLEKKVHTLLAKNKLKSAYVKIIVTRGTSEGLLVPSGKTDPTIAMFVLPHAPLPRAVYEKGIRACIAEVNINKGSPADGKKTLNYIANILFRMDSRENGFEDAIFMNSDGSVTEATSSNLFIVDGKKIYTPPVKSGILPGITREEIIRLVRRRSARAIQEKCIKKNDLFDADELFLTNSISEVVPVVKVGGRTIGRGSPGKVTGDIASLFKASVGEYCSIAGKKT